MMPNGPWQLEATDQAGINYGIVPLPGDVQQATILGGEDIVASKQAPLDAVWKFMTFMQDPINATPAVINGLGLLPMQNVEENQAKWYGNPHNRVFAQVLKIARSRAYGPRYAQIAPHLWTMEQQVLTGEDTPQHAVATAWSAIKPLLPGS